MRDDTKVYLRYAETLAHDLIRESGEILMPIVLLNREGTDEMLVLTPDSTQCLRDDGMDSNLYVQRLREAARKMRSTIAVMLAEATVTYVTQGVELTKMQVVVILIEDPDGPDIRVARLDTTVGMLRLGDFVQISRDAHLVGRYLNILQDNTVN